MAHHITDHYHRKTLTYFCHMPQIIMEKNNNKKPTNKLVPQTRKLFHIHFFVLTQAVKVRQSRNGFFKPTFFPRTIEGIIFFKIL